MCFISWFSLQPLVFTTFSLAKAEEMADLIDGYCMLFSGKKHSLVFKKLGRVKSLDSTAFIIQGTKNWHPLAQQASFNLLMTSGFHVWCTNHLASWPCCLLPLKYSVPTWLPIRWLEDKCKYSMLGFYINPCLHLPVSILVLKYCGFWLKITIQADIFTWTH